MYSRVKHLKTSALHKVEEELGTKTQITLFFIIIPSPAFMSQLIKNRMEKNNPHMKDRYFLSLGRNKLNGDPLLPKTVDISNLKETNMRLQTTKTTHFLKRHPMGTICACFCSTTINYTFQFV